MTNIDSSKGKFLRQTHILQIHLPRAVANVSSGCQALWERAFQYQDSFRRQLGLYVCTGVLCLVSLVGYANASLAATINTENVNNVATTPEVTSAAKTSPFQATNSQETAIQAPDIAAEKVDQFAQAYLQVLILLNERQADLPANATSDDTAKVEQSIETDAAAIIEQSGLTMPEYTQILSLASQDEAFRSQVLSRIDILSQMAEGIANEGNAD